MKVQIVHEHGDTFDAQFVEVSKRGIRLRFSMADDKYFDHYSGSGKGRMVSWRISDESMRRIREHVAASARVR